MLKIIHRVNKIAQLKQIPKEFGVEIDVRGYGNRILLNHDPIDDPSKYDELEEYLKHYDHSFIIFNIKEAGYEKRVLDLASKYGIEDYFLLDVEFPFIYRATRKDNFKKIAIRYSEAEPVENVLAQMQDGKPLVDWVWIDTNTMLPIDESVLKKLKSFKTCIVCPDRWGRQDDIPKYVSMIKNLGFKPDAVMTTLEHVNRWDC